VLPSRGNAATCGSRVNLTLLFRGHGVVAGRPLFKNAGVLRAWSTPLRW